MEYLKELKLNFDYSNFVVISGIFSSEPDLKFVIKNACAESLMWHRVAPGFNLI